MTRQNCSRENPCAQLVSRAVHLIHLTRPDRFHETLAFNSSVHQHELIWLDRTGNRIGSGIPVGRYAHPTLAPDARQAVFDRDDPAQNNTASSEPSGYHTATPNLIIKGAASAMNCLGPCGPDFASPSDIMRRSRANQLADAVGYYSSCGVEERDETDCTGAWTSM